MESSKDPTKCYVQIKSDVPIYGGLKGVVVDDEDLTPYRIDIVNNLKSVWDLWVLFPDESNQDSTFPSPFALHEVIFLED